MTGRGRRNDGRGVGRCSGSGSWWVVWGGGAYLVGVAVGVRCCSVGGGGLGRCAVLGEVPAASAGMTDLLSRGCGGEGVAGVTGEASAGVAGRFCVGVVEPFACGGE